MSTRKNGVLTRETSRIKKILIFYSTFKNLKAIQGHSNYFIDLFINLNTDSLQNFNLIHDGGRTEKCIINYNEIKSLINVSQIFSKTKKIFDISVNKCLKHNHALMIESFLHLSNVIHLDHSSAKVSHIEFFSENLNYQKVSTEISPFSYKLRDTYHNTYSANTINRKLNLKLLRCDRFSNPHLICRLPEMSLNKTIDSNMLDDENQLLASDGEYDVPNCDEAKQPAKTSRYEQTLKSFGGFTRNVASPNGSESSISTISSKRFRENSEDAPQNRDKIHRSESRLENIENELNELHVNAIVSPQIPNLYRSQEFSGKSSQIDSSQRIFQCVQSSSKRSNELFFLADQNDEQNLNQATVSAHRGRPVPDFFEAEIDHYFREGIHAADRSADSNDRSSLPVSSDLIRPNPTRFRDERVNQPSSSGMGRQRPHQSPSGLSRAYQAMRNAPAPYNMAIRRGGVTSRLSSQGSNHVVRQHAPLNDPVIPAPNIIGRDPNAHRFNFFIAPLNYPNDIIDSETEKLFDSEVQAILDTSTRNPLINVEFLNGRYGAIPVICYGLQATNILRTLIIRLGNRPQFTPYILIEETQFNPPPICELRIPNSTENFDEAVEHIRAANPTSNFNYDSWRLIHTNKSNRNFSSGSSFIFAAEAALERRIVQHDSRRKELSFILLSYTRGKGHASIRLNQRYIHGSGNLYFNLEIFNLSLNSLCIYLFKSEALLTDYKMKLGRQLEMRKLCGKPLLLWNLQSSMVRMEMLMKRWKIKPAHIMSKNKINCKYFEMKLINLHLLYTVFLFHQLCNTMIFTKRNWFYQIVIRYYYLKNFQTLNKNINKNNYFKLTLIIKIIEKQLLGKWALGLLGPVCNVRLKI